MDASSDPMTDILPIIARYAIDRGSYFKSFRSVNRLFKSTADKVFPRGDNIFANWRKTLIRKYNMVPTFDDAVMMDLPNISVGLPTIPLMRALGFMKWIDLDQLVENLIKNTYFDNDFTSGKVYGKCDYVNTIRWLVEICMMLPRLEFQSVMFDKTISDLSFYMEYRGRFVPISVVSANPDYKWNWNDLSINRNVTKEFYLENIDKPWNIRELVYNPGVDYEFAKFLDPMECLYRIDVPWEELEANLQTLADTGFVIYTKPHCVISHTCQTRWQKLTAIETEGQKWRRRCEFILPSSWKDEDQILTTPAIIISTYGYQENTWARKAIQN